MGEAICAEKRCDANAWNDLQAGSIQGMDNVRVQRYNKDTVHVFLISA